MGKVNEEHLERAKSLYMEYKSLADIERKTGISRDVLNYHVHKKADSWKNIREGNKIALLDSFTEAKKGQLVSISKSCISIIHRALVDLESSEEITLKDAKMATDILTEMDRIVKLDDGEATSRNEVISQKPMSIEQLRTRLIASDPFLTEGEITHEENSITGESAITKLEYTPSKDN